MIPIDGQKGFTLLELMIALTILGLMITAIFSSLRLGLRAWQKGEERVEQYQRIRVVLEMLETQLRSIYPYRIEDKETKEKFPFFRGEKDSIKFVSSVSFKTEEPMGLCLVWYRVRREDRDLGYAPAKAFLASEELILNEDIFEEETLEEREGVELFPEVKHISFQYYGKKKGDEREEWNEKWDAKEEKVLPSAVKISIDLNKTYEEDPLLFYTITVPLPMGQRR